VGVAHEEIPIGWIPGDSLRVPTVGGRGIGRRGWEVADGAAEIGLQESDVRDTSTLGLGDRVAQLWETKER